MILRWNLGWLPAAFVFVVASGAAERATAASCVWKVTSAQGGTLFLGGSIHALRSSDYPLPAAFNHALDASSRLVIEANPQALKAASKALSKEGEYGKGDALKNHVDPRTYEYVRRFFALQHVPEEKFSHYRPWLIDIMLESPPAQNTRLGVDEYLKSRALAAHKEVDGLETAQEHVAPFVGLNDRQGEALLLVFFINLGRVETGGHDSLLSAWHHGDADALAGEMREAYRDFPSFNDRLIGARNRRWIPKIERYISSGQTVFVVVGAGHLGGKDGVLSLLRTRGYTIEQL